MVAASPRTPAIASPNRDAMAEIESMVRAQVCDQRLTPGAALAVFLKGEPVIDLVVGYADTQRATTLEAASLFPMFSGSKPFGAVALWQQIERGRIGLDDRVADLWPAFGQNGKDAILVRHILCHQGGFPSTPDSLPPSSWGDRDRVNRVIEQLGPELDPGSVSAYHFLTQHWVIAELIRLVDGRSYRDYLQDEILNPLGLENTHIMVVGDLEERCVKLHATDGTDEWGVEVIQSTHIHPIYRDVVPGGSLVSDAAGMARFYSAIALGGAIDGVQILGPETVNQMLAIAVLDEIDPSFDLPVRRCYGFELGGLDEPRRHWPGATSTERTFWHGGMGTSVCWADRDTEIAMAFLTNGVRRDKAGAIARRDLSDAVRMAFR
ncbi:MAG TPA: serine hydrolase domain-containing protein [Thermomicrobiales bacterium]|nr:serine hydrolase domain-containing protein [Thermomicrobiales bacterium]